MAIKRVFITSGTTFTVPSDFSSLVSVEVIGGGGSGGNAANSGGGGGGGYALSNAITGLTANQGVFVSIGFGGPAGPGAPNTGGQTWFNTTNTAPSSSTTGVLATGGTVAVGSNGGGGGAGTVGTTLRTGGGGGNGLSSGLQQIRGGGGGAAGPNGNGANGGDAHSTNPGGAGAGGGGNGGSVGGTGTATVGGTGGNGFGGTGGGAGATSTPTAAVAGTSGTSGGGGGGFATVAGIANNGAAGGTGSFWTSSTGVTAGPGGGGGGSALSGAGSTTGGNGALYGAGGGGGGTTGNGGGGPGIVVFTYNTVTRYWVGGTGTWDTTSTTNWSSTSGGPGGASVPTTGQDVVFNSLSGTGTVTLTGALACQGLVTTGAGAFTFTGTGTLNIAGNFLTLVANITWSATGLVTFSASGTITVANTMSCSLTIDPTIGIPVALGSNLTITGQLGWTTGNLTLNNFNIGCTSIFILNTSSKVITPGTGVFNVTGGGTMVNISTTGQVTFSGTRPTININNNSAIATTVSIGGFNAASAWNINVTTGTYALTLSSGATVANLNFTGFTGTWSPGSATATFYGSLTMVAGMTHTAATIGWTFGATSTGQTITSAGKSFGQIAFNGAGGAWTLTDAFSVTSGGVIYNQGTFNSANFAMTVVSMNYVTVGGACAINLGSSTVTCTGNTATIWNFSTVTGLTFNAGTSTITSTGLLAKIFAGGGLTYNNVSFTGTTPGISNAFTGANTFANLTLAAGVSGRVTYTFDSNQIITSTLSVTSASPVNRAQLSSSVAGTQRTITAAARTLSNCNFQDIAAAGATIPWSGTNLGDYGNNTNITFVTTSYFWVGGNGAWNDTSTTNWATSSGGGGGVAIPLPQDNVAFDVNSNVGTTAFTMTIGTGGAVCNNLTVSGLDAIMTIAGTTTLTVYGSFALPATNLLATYSGTLTFAGTGTKTISTNGTPVVATTFNGPGSTWTLGSAYSTPQTMTFLAGTFNTGNFALSASTLIYSGTAVCAINLGSSAVSLRATGTMALTAGANLTFNAGTSTISFAAVALGNLAFDCPGVTFHNVNMDFGAGNYTATGANTFNNLALNNSSTNNRIQFLSLSGNWTVNGTLSCTTATAGTSRVYVLAATVGTNQTISAATTTLTDIDFRNITAAGTGTWTGTRIGNLGGCTGITFSTPKTVFWNLAAGASSNPGWASNAWAVSSGGTVAPANYPLPQDTAIFDDAGLNSGATVTCSTTGLGNAFNGYVGIINTTTRTQPMNLIFSQHIGNITLIAGVTVSGTMLPANLGSVLTYNQNSATSSASITTNASFGAMVLSNVVTTGNFTCDVSVTLTTNVTFAAFLSSGTSTRQIGFGTNSITVTGTGVILNINGTGFTYTGTPTVNFSNNSATLASIALSVGSWTESNAINVNITTGTYTLSENLNNFYRNLNYTGFAGTVGNGGKTIYGDLTIPAAGGTYTAGSQIWQFARTSGTQTITTNGRTIDWPLTQNGTGGTVLLAGALTLGVTRTYTFSGGTLNLNNFILTAGNMVSNTGTRSIAFGTTGAITVIGSGAQLLWMVGTNFTYTGTPTINISNNSSIQSTVITQNFTDTNAVDLNVTTGSYIIVLSSNNVFRSLNFTGFSGTWQPGSDTYTFFGNLTLVNAMTYTSSNETLNFNPGTGVVATFTCANKTVINVTQAGLGTVTLGSNASVVNFYTFTTGILNLATFTLSVGLFTSVNTNTRQIQFGTGTITAGQQGGTIFNVAGTNLTYTGTPTVTIINPNSQLSATVTAIDFIETNAFNFNFQAPSYSSLTITNGSVFKSLNFTNFSGGWNSSTSSYTFYGNLTLVSGMTYTTPSSGSYTFANTSGIATLTSAGKTLYAITESGAGGTLAFSGATTLSNALTFTAGTLQLPASTTTTVGAFVTTGTTPKFLTSSAAGTQAILSKTTGTVTVTYLSIKDSAATGGAVFSAADPTNTNAGNNTGWLGFAGGTTGNFFLLF